MEIRDAARAVLGGTTLADKLAPLEALTDAAPGPAIEAPDAPGRPSGLGFSDARARAPFPSDARLEDPSARGIVLHFFANHELLALELMALALLRFPDADPGFRRGLVGVMREEQAHLRMYVDRMALAGVSLGDVPVNRFFWDCLVGAATPASFVAGLSLTFEQANLDFAAHYAAAFRAAGDEDTGAVLDRVLADEIRHVGHGLRWFERWRAPGPLFERWVEALPGPLTPARAKGRGFVRAPRREAGFDDETITRLEVSSTSKGKRPTLFRFDPEVESEAAGLPPTRAGAAIAGDLELLPAFLAAGEDVLLVREPPRLTFLAELHAAGFQLPELATRLDERPWGGLEPWGWSPRVCDELRTAGARSWEPGWRRFFSKAWAAGLPRPEADWLAPPEDRAVPCASATEVREAVRALGERPFVLKAPFSTAGRDRRWALDDAWVERTLATQGAVVVEPWLDAVADFSFQGRGARVEGWGRFFTDGRGQYRGAWLARPGDGLAPEVARFVNGDGVDQERFARVFAEVGETLGDALDGWPGPWGVDALVYRRPDGLRLQPLLEVNPRATMGRVALALRRRVLRGVPARFDLLPKAQVRPRSPTLDGGLIVDGVVPLTDPERAQRIVAVLSVGKDVRPD